MARHNHDLFHSRTHDGMEICQDAGHYPSLLSNQDTILASSLIRGAREWVDSFENGGKDEKILRMGGRTRRFYCCWGKKVEGMEESMGRVVDAWVMRCVGEWWQRRKILLFGSG